MVLGRQTRVADAPALYGWHHWLTGRICCGVSCGEVQVAGAGQLGWSPTRRSTARSPALQRSLGQVSGHTRFLPFPAIPFI